MGKVVSVILAGGKGKRMGAEVSKPVSYTHLTLPTILRV